MNRTEALARLKELQLRWDRIRVELADLIAALDQEPSPETTAPAAAPAQPASHVSTPTAEPQVLPKPKGPTFVGRVFVARAGGTCTVCGSQIEAGQSTCGTRRPNAVPTTPAGTRRGPARVAEKPFTMLIIDAAGASALPQDLRHLIFTMAYLADSKSGRGLSGQDTIGRFMGCSAREVRRKLDRLDALDSPVRIVRSPRYRKEGRTSDEYRLELANRTPTSASQNASTGRPRPLADHPDAGGLPDVKRTPTGRETSELPDAHVLGSSQGILSADPRSLSARSPRAASTPRKVRTSQPKRVKPEHTDEQRQAHRQLTDHYFADFERLRGARPIGWGAKEGKAVWILLEKLKFDSAAAARIVTNGLQSWNKATIMTIAADPSACIAVAVPRAATTNGELLGFTRRRIQELEAEERRGKAGP
jgi:hypothetical protein